MSFLREPRQCTRNESIKANNNSEISKFATTFVLGYFQSWGNTLEYKIDLLNSAVKWAGINATFVQSNGKCGWQGKSNKELEKGKKFREELDKSFPIGSVEAEICAVIDIIQRYKKENSFWHKLFRI